ncbi:hypothetical protein AFK76_12735 [Idiomarina zobellii]|uniref:Uncharacterized protein n=1 Tax=Idiomarina zobellii TaxID=86103 RepID=A0A837N7G8_9GAMM|nr:hypothetical protein AFK76_12735 [Idiomarina zobellii]
MTSEEFLLIFSQVFKQNGFHKVAKVERAKVRASKIDTNTTEILPHCSKMSQLSGGLQCIRKKLKKLQRKPGN